MAGISSTVVRGTVREVKHYVLTITTPNQAQQDFDISDLGATHVEQYDLAQAPQYHAESSSLFYSLARPLDATTIRVHITRTSGGGSHTGFFFYLTARRYAK